MPATDLAHPVENRPLSVQEYRKIQEFPDDWQIEGSILEQYKQIGNAVPVSLARAIGNLIVSLLEKKKVTQIEGFKYSRYKGTSDKDWI
jgi:DNA (cytosine-5)-methyltransferase 1